MYNPRRLSHSTGFTILELLIASSVFAVIMLVVAVGVIRFTNEYYGGVTSSKTQEVARAIMAAVSQSIQFGKKVNNLSASGSVQGVCIDNTLYAFSVGQQIIDSPSSPQVSKHQGYHGLVTFEGNDCSGGIPSNIATSLGSPGASALPAGARELLGQHMRISALTVSGSGSLYTIHVRVIYGDDDLLSPTPPPVPAWATEKCGSQAGSQFCAVSDLTTTVERRLL
jgi:prepilin-type N-terminal cleavage/methylation domain-containing protein